MKKYRRTGRSSAIACKADQIDDKFNAFSWFAKALTIHVLFSFSFFETSVHAGIFSFLLLSLVSHGLQTP